MNSTSSTLNALLIGVIVVAITYFARDLLIPLACAAILSFILAVPVRALQKLRLPRPLAVVAVVVAAFLVIFALGRVVGGQVAELAEDVPKYQATIREKIEALNRLQDQGAGTLQRAQGVLRELDQALEDAASRIGQAATPAGATPADRSFVPVEVREPLGGPLRTLIALVTPLLGPLASAALIVVFVIFILIEREDIRDRLIRLAGFTDIPHATAALDDAAHRLSHLFLAQISINSSFGALIGLCLWRIGVPSAVVWGVLAAVLRFVPYVGTLLALVFPLVLAVSVGSGWSMAIWTLALFMGLDFVTGQFVDPVFIGRTTGLTPIAIVIAATFWSWIWGPIGLVLATPLTVVLVVLGRHFQALKVFDILLGDEPALSEPQTLYQRMLAHDPVEAANHARAFMTAHSLSEYCDRVAAPALALACKDAERGALAGDILKAFQKTFERLFADIARQHWVARRESRIERDMLPGRLPVVRPDQLAERWVSNLPFVSVGARAGLDEAAACVIATLAETHGVRTRIEKPHGLSAAQIEKLDISQAAVVCLSCLDLRTPERIQAVAGRIRAKAPQAKLVLGLWTAADEAAIESLKDAANPDFTFASFSEAASWILKEALEPPPQTDSTAAEDNARAPMTSAVLAGSHLDDGPAAAS